MKSDLTVLVFKDNSSARTFRVPSRWISRLGLIAGVVAAIACLGVFLSLKYYLAARQAIQVADPAYVEDLEAEVASLRASQSVPQPQPATPSAPAVVQGQGQGLQTGTAGGSHAQAAPAPTVTVTVTPPVSQANAAPGSSAAFSAVPATATILPANDVPITLYEPHIGWSGRTLKVQFFIQYAREDKGNQQGRIVLLARGPDTVLAYPAGVLNTSETESLISPEKGEYFSVSRIREVKADFGPLKSRTALKGVEVFLFNTEGKLLIHQTLAPADDTKNTSQDSGGSDDEKEAP